MSGTYDGVDAQVDAQVHQRAHIVLDLLALELADRFLEELHIHLEPDGLDVPALLSAEETAGSANFEVERGNPESAAEIAELLDRREPLFGDRRQIVFGRNQQVRVGRAIRSADTAAQLIQLRQAVAVGAIDDDRVGVRNIETVFDDRRGQQHVELARDEVEHGALERVLVHLAVAHHDARFGNQPPHQVADRKDRFDTIVDEEDLAAAFELAANRPADHLLIEFDDVGLDRQAILRRRFDDRHVANADERHVQRPRNRRRGHRQHVDLALELFDPLLVRHAEPLLLVDDEQTEVAELARPSTAGDGCRP